MSADASLSQQLCALRIFVRVTQVVTQKTSRRQTSADTKRWKSERTIMHARYFRVFWESSIQNGCSVGVVHEKVLTDILRVIHDWFLYKRTRKKCK